MAGHCERKGGCICEPLRCSRDGCKHWVQMRPCENQFAKTVNFGHAPKVDEGKPCSMEQQEALHVKFADLIAQGYIAPLNPHIDYAEYQGVTTPQEAEAVAKRFAHVVTKGRTERQLSDEMKAAQQARQMKIAEFAGKFIAEYSGEAPVSVVNVIKIVIEAIEVWENSKYYQT